MKPETPQELPPAPEPQPETISPPVTTQEPAQAASELEARSDRYHTIMMRSGIAGVALTGYAAAGMLVGEVAGDTIATSPLAQWSYFGTLIMGVCALATSFGARESRNGYWSEALDITQGKTPLDDREQ